MKGSLLVFHGGGPTPVMNASLYGVIAEAKENPGVGKIYGARGGSGGLLNNELIDLGAIPESKLEKLPVSPGSAIGTSRDMLREPEYGRIAEILKEREIRYLLCNGGNGTMDTCGKIYEASRAAGVSELFVIGIPKTVDNDLAMTDHSPGYGSAARFMAASVAEVAVDLESLPIHVVVVEALGRDAGWITAASALAKDSYGAGPDLVYVPEKVFNEQQFLEDVRRLISEKHSGLVVVSEGLKDAEGKPIVKPIFEVGRAVYYGDTSSHLANLVVKELGFKARSEKPGLMGRASIAWQSGVDRNEAMDAGRLAVRAAVTGENNKMVAFKRVRSEPYTMEPYLADIRDVIKGERNLPDEFINERGNGITREFVEWCRPLVGPLPGLIRFS